MTGREKVIELLQETAEYFRECRSNASFASKAENHFWELQNAANEVAELLKEREAKPMTEYDDGWDCPRCGLKLVGKTASGYPCDVLDLPNDEIVKYCPVCGQAVKRDD